MDTDQQAAHPKGYLSSVFGCHCPRCRHGKLFKHKLNLRLKNVLLMNDRCSVCGQPTEIEPGFYYGTGYVSYGLTVALSVASFFAWWMIIGLSVNDKRLFGWLIFNAILLIVMQPWLMRISRSIWIAMFVKYDPQWKEHNMENFERAMPGQM